MIGMMMNFKQRRLMKKKVIISLIMAMTLMACEKGYIAEGSEASSSTEAVEGGVPVTFKIAAIEQVDFGTSSSVAVSSSSSSSIADYCTRINLAVFDTDDTKTSVNQTSDDSDFGTLSLSLAEGTYEVVVLAHSCTGNATISSCDEIKFPNNKLTDTFYYYGEITVSGEGSYDITLARAVAMFRFIVTDSTPEDVTQMQFYYTGGSSTFDATTGFGCVNSRQTEVRDVSSDAYTGQSQYEVYTLPHATDDTLKMVVTALDASENTILERTFTGVPVTVNKITQYTGEFFTSISEAVASTIILSISDEWETEEYSY